MFLAYATDTGHAFIDREMYLPRCWADDLGRRRAAGIPEGQVLATRQELARRA